VRSRSRSRGCGAELRGLDGVFLDEEHTHAIRAFVRDSRGARGPLPDQLIADAQRVAAAEQVSSVEGEEQTDLVPQSIDKGRGVRSLVSALGAGARSTARLRSPSPSATRPRISRSSRWQARVRSGARQASARRAFHGDAGAYQQGFAEAVGSLVGHAPGSCPQCRLAGPSAERRLLLGVLGVRERASGAADPGPQADAAARDGRHASAGRRRSTRISRRASGDPDARGGRLTFHGRRAVHYRWLGGRSGKRADRRSIDRGDAMTELRLV